MGISNWNLDYSKTVYSYTLQRHLIGGQDEIKRHNTLYLPMPSGFLDPNKPAPETSAGQYFNVLQDPGDWRKRQQQLDPSYHPNEPYRAYLKGARVPDILSATFRSLHSIGTSMAPDITLPAAMEHLLEGATKDGRTLVELYNDILAHTLLYGRYILMADVCDFDGEIRFVTYDAESFTNWQVDTTSGGQVINWGIFTEWVTADEDTRFSPPTKPTSILAEINEGGKFQTSVWIDDTQTIESISVPSYKGRALEFVPTTCIGSVNFKYDVDPIPTVGISQIAIEIYNKSADLNMSERTSALPMLVLSGVSDDEIPVTVGPTVALVMSDPAAKAYYPQTDTSALEHIRNHIKDLFEEAKVYGLSLLGSNQKSAETAETARLRQAAAGVNLEKLVIQSAAGLQRALMNVGVWMGLPDSALEEISVIPNTEFSDAVLTAQEQTALLQTWMAGGIASSEYRWNLRRAGLLPTLEEAEMEEELALEDLGEPNLSDDDTGNDNDNNDSSGENGGKSSTEDDS